MVHSPCLSTHFVCQILFASVSIVLYYRCTLTLDLSSSRIQMAALGHTSTPFCFVIRQLLGFFPGQFHLSEVPFDDIYPVLPRSSWLSLVTSHFPVCCLTSCSRVVHSQDVSQPCTWAFFLLLYLPVSLNHFSFWCLHFWLCPSMRSPTVFSGTYEWVSE